MEDLHWIGLKAIPGIGNVTFRRLLERFETPEAVLSAPPTALAGVRGVTPAIREAITLGSWRGFAEAECRRLAASGARIGACQPDCVNDFIGLLLLSGYLSPLPTTMI
jgi:DNA processing protein